MIVRHWKHCSNFVVIGAALLGVAAVSRADVTVEEKTSFDVAFFKANGVSVEQYTADKKHRDYKFGCEGFMSILCGKNDSGEIIRLDKDTTYDLQPKKKQYREHAFPTAAERAELKRRIAENMEKMKQCSAQQPAAKPAVDPNKCQMSPPKIDVKNLGDDGQILGHGVHHSVVSLTQSCTNKETGDVCDMQFGFDLWLTADKIPGLEDRVAFEKAYLAKLGLTGDNGVINTQQVQMALAPYAEQMKQLKSKMGDVKGQPLRSAFNLSYGGPHCAAANKSNSDSAQNGGSDSTAGGGSIGARALSEVGGKLLSGMFSKKKKDDAAADTAKTEPAAPGMVSMVKFSTETTAINTAAVPADQFEIPAGWTKIVPKAEGKEEPFECPKNGRGE